MFTQLWDNINRAIELGAEISNANGAPVAIMQRDGWFSVCEEPPDDMEPSPLDDGWTIVALVEPDAWA